MALKCFDRFARPGIPEDQTSIRAAGEKVLAVGTEGHTEDGAGMIALSVELLSGCRIPNQKLSWFLSGEDSLLKLPCPLAGLDDFECGRATC